MSKERPDVLYHKVAMDWVMANEPERLNGLMKKCLGLDTGHSSP